jgi:hypothetical protein
VIGTPYFIAPEMVRGLGSVCKQSDVAILGATLHYIVTGSYRYNGKSTLSVLSNAYYSQDYLYPLEVHSELATLINKSCAKDKKARYRSVKELREAIESYIQHRTAFDLLDQGLKKLHFLKSAYEYSFKSNQTKETQNPSYREGIDVAYPPILTPADFREIALECRLLVNQSLLIVPKYRPAQHTLNKILTLWTSFEVQQKQYTSAKALYGQIKEPPLKLSKSLHLLKAQTDEADLNQQRLNQLSYSLNFEGTKTHSVLLILHGLFWGLIFLTLGYFHKTQVIEFTPLNNLYASSIGVLCTGIIIFGFRSFLTDTYHRVLFTRFFMSYLLFEYGIRFVYLYADFTFEQSMLIDFILFTLFLISCSTLLHRLIVWSVLISILCLIGVLFFTQYTFEILALDVLCANLCVAYIVYPKENIKDLN